MKQSATRIELFRDEQNILEIWDSHIKFKSPQKANNSDSFTILSGIPISPINSEGTNSEYPGVKTHIKYKLISVQLRFSVKEGLCI